MRLKLEPWIFFVGVSIFLFIFNFRGILLKLKVRTTVWMDETTKPVFLPAVKASFKVYILFHDFNFSAFYSWDQSF